MRRASFRIEVGAALALSVLAGSPAVRAAEDARLVYSRTVDAVQCPDESTLRDAVAARLGYDPFVAYSARSMVVEIRAEGASLKARVYLVETDDVAGGVRDLSSPELDCKELTSAVALAISIAIDPGVIDRSPTEPPARAAALAADASPESVAPADSVPSDAPAIHRDFPDVGALPTKEPSRDRAPSPRRSTAHDRATALVFGVGVGGLVASGPEPPPVAGASLLATLRGEHWEASVSPRWDFQTSATNGSGGSAHMTSYGASLAPCYRSGPVLGCYVLESALVVSQGSGVTNPHTGHALWIAQGPRLAYQWQPKHALGVVARLDGLWALERIGLELDGAPVYQTPRFLGRVGLDVTHEF
jgi:hypothetical protein